MVSVVTFLCCLLLASGAAASEPEPESSAVRAVEPSRAAALTALAAIARRHPQSVQRLLAAFAAAAAAARVSAERGGGDYGGGGGGVGGPQAANFDVLVNSRTVRWEMPPEAEDWSPAEAGGAGDSQESERDSSDEAAEELDSEPFVSSGVPAAAGRTTKRALSVLSRWQPFTSLGNGGRRAGRFSGRARPIGAPRDFISAETRGDFGDRPLGQPMRWGRR